MIRHSIFKAVLVVWIAAAAAQPLAALAAPAAPAQGGLGMMGLTGSHSKEPMHLNADGGIEWQQDTKSYIARDNAVATRGDVTLRADTITAYYRDAAKPGTTEIWRVVAVGGVRISTPTQSVVGDVATYDLDQAVIVVTGKVIRLITAQDIVTAQKSLEWYDHRQLAVARGGAVVRHADKVLRGDVLAAQLVSAPGQQAHLSRVDAFGHVMVSAPGQIGSGSAGVYDVSTGLVTLRGHVVLVRGENTLSGAYGVVDLSKGVSRLIPEGGSHPRVEGYIVPQRKSPAAE